MIHCSLSEWEMTLFLWGSVPGGVSDIKVVWVPVGNFHDRP